ncbi:MAG TPA: PH domain-containing protein [Opitutaceae bacterium]
MSALREQHGEPTDMVFAAADAGFRVRMTTSFAIAILVAILIVNTLVIPRPPGNSFSFAVLGPLGGLFIIAAVWYVARIRCYRLTGGFLVVERVLPKPQFPLVGLESVAFEPGSTAYAFKVIGIDGLGAMAGRFRNLKLGKFRAYLTDGDRAVVLRWPKQTLVVSPERPADFVEAVRKRTGVVAHR